MDLVKIREQLLYATTSRLQITWTLEKQTSAQTITYQLINNPLFTVMRTFPNAYSLQELQVDTHHFNSQAGALLEA